jgi:hypothetical protein
VRTQLLKKGGEALLWVWRELFGKRKSVSGLIVVAVDMYRALFHVVTTLAYFAFPPYGRMMVELPRLSSV